MYMCLHLLDPLAPYVYVSFASPWLVLAPLNCLLHFCARPPFHHSRFTAQDGCRNQRDRRRPNQQPRPPPVQTARGLFGRRGSRPRGGGTRGGGVRGGGGCLRPFDPPQNWHGRRCRHLAHGAGWRAILKGGVVFRRGVIRGGVYRGGAFRSFRGFRGGILRGGVFRGGGSISAGRV